MISKRYRNDGKASIRLNEIRKRAKLDVEQKLVSGVYQLEDALCPVCHSTEYEHLAEKDRYGLYCNTVICKTCGLLITTPMMTQDSLNLFYSGDFDALCRGNERAELHRFPSQLWRGKRIVKFIRKYDPVFSFEGKLVLEAGCGAGGILLAFRDAGALVKGFDIGPDLEYGIREYGLCLEQGTIENYREERKPDIIVYSHVLEHLPHPHEELKKIKELCHEKTLVYIEVPGVLSLHKSDGDFLRYLLNVHLYCFSLGTLNNFLTVNGFTLVFGNEHVRSLFVSTPTPARIKIINLYHENMAYLRKTEHKRHINVFKMRVHAKLCREICRARSKTITVLRYFMKRKKI
jgi:2-polyprenyl-3-methyl-5-hydroxy-6-metoxy-1,4-benzoquinol methylase